MPLLVVIGAIVLVAGAIARLDEVAWVGLVILLIGCAQWLLSGPSWWSR